ncbi:ankyrin repeat domain-containing protein [Vibrio mexicanus]|uniref:ankyrin repeat domain-containing protein n=1 Tax=Vibrio mexicanus TaxID=1004326 RepID=UPI00063CC3DA|nr:ankyrin repeat domain-containing protein [Vibrio mexicanus]
MSLPALHRSIINNDFEQFSSLIEGGSDVNQLDPVMGNSPLHIAAQQGSEQWVVALLEANAFINLQTPKHGVTPLMVAVWHRKPAMVATLLKQGDINIEIVSTFGLKAEHLVEFGANDDDQYGLAQAAEMAEMFEAYRANRTLRESDLAAYQIVTSGDDTDAQKAQQLAQLTDWATLNETSAITSSGNDEHTAVMVAARDGDIEALKVLMEQGGDQTIPDHYMKAIPLHKAAYNGRPDVIRLLAHYSGFQETLNAQGPNNGYTPLHDAIWHGHVEAAKVLIDAGARTDLVGYDGKTPLMLAKEYRYQNIVDLLETK